MSAFGSRRSGYVGVILTATGVSMCWFALFVGVVFVLPATAPALWLAVPGSVLAGMIVIARRLPEQTYPIGLVFVPIMCAVLSLAVLQVYWSVLGDSL